MPCFSPLSAWQTDAGAIVFSERAGVRRALSLPCGQCVGCRLERSRQWAVRCIHEAQLHSHNCFVTLTYNDANLCESGSLDYRDFQLFMKRLRKVKGRVRFFMCGEYGDLNSRPHFHACLFGVRFEDQKVFRTVGETCLYTSESLSKLWPFGFCTIGQVNFETAAYVARYVMKKVTGSAADAAYTRVNVDTGEVVKREPEFCHMSLKPGIGAKWFEKYKRDVYPHDYVVVNGRQSRPPRYYDTLLQRVDPDMFESLEVPRYEKALRGAEDTTPARLAVREQVTNARLALKKRSL